MNHTNQICELKSNDNGRIEYAKACRYDVTIRLMYRDTHYMLQGHFISNLSCLNCITEHKEASTHEQDAHTCGGAACKY